jgi:hypothetical protein
VDIQGLERLPGTATPAALVESFLRRLKRVLLLRFYTDALLSTSDRRLLDQAIYSTYCDCQTLGAGDEAHRLLDEARAGKGLFKRPLAAAR